MKNQSHVSQLMLELYSRGLSTNKERRLIEKALETDSKTRERYEALQRSDREIRSLIAQELSRMNLPQKPLASPPLPKKKPATLYILAAAIILCVLVPGIIYIQNINSNKGSAIAEEAGPETNTPAQTEFSEKTPGTEIAVTPEPQITIEGNSNRTEISENPDTETNGTPKLELQFDYWDDSWDREALLADIHQQLLKDNEWLSDSDIDIIAKIEPEEKTVWLRGGSQDGTIPEEQPSNINIPPGISFIFENMFANRDLSFVIIPSRITSIGKNAFSGNPLVSVTIGANVSIEDNAIPGNFAAFYNAAGKAAGTYTRPDANSDAWEKK